MSCDYRHFFDWRAPFYWQWPHREAIHLSPLLLSGSTNSDSVQTRDRRRNVSGNFEDYEGNFQHRSEV